MQNYVCFCLVIAHVGEKNFEQISREYKLGHVIGKKFGHTVISRPLCKWCSSSIFADTDTESTLKEAEKKKISPRKKGNEFIIAWQKGC
jgi:hypothetical protein